MYICTKAGKQCMILSALPVIVKPMIAVCLTVAGLAEARLITGHLQDTVSHLV